MHAMMDKIAIAKRYATSAGNNTGSNNNSGSSSGSADFPKNDKVDTQPAYRPLISRAAAHSDFSAASAETELASPTATGYVVAEHAFLQSMQDSDLDSFLYLAAWANNTDSIRKAIARPSDAERAFSWLCSRMRQPGSDISAPWTRAWKALCEQLPKTIAGACRSLALATATMHEQRRHWFIQVVESSLTIEFMQVARVLPSQLGWPFIQSLRGIAESLGIDLTAQVLMRPSEGVVLLWYTNFWELRGTITKKIKFPKADVMLDELLRVHRCDVSADQAHAIINRSDDRKPTVKSRFPRQTSNGKLGLPGPPLHSTRSDLEEILFGLDEERGPDAEFVHRASQWCISVLEAICNAFDLMKPRRARLSRMRDLIGLVTGSYDQGFVRLVVAPQLFLTFELEEEALTFYIFTMQKLDVQQVVANFEKLQDQSQRCIRLHSNPLFACLRITAAVCTICRRGGMMREIWAEEHGRLKKIAVQIFEMLPQTAFDKIFENTGIQQMFLELAIQKAECLDMLDIPRFKDYLHPAGMEFCRCLMKSIMLTITSFIGTGFFALGRWSSALEFDSSSVRHASLCLQWSASASRQTLCVIATYSSVTRTRCSGFVS
jgi:hypothetical protein